MDSHRIWKERLKFFLIGAVSVFLLLVVTGARDMSDAPALDNGRFQIAAWATHFDNKSGVIGAFIVDTVSGETKTVYTREYGSPPVSKVLKNDLRKNFANIR